MNSKAASGYTGVIGRHTGIQNSAASTVGRRGAKLAAGAAVLAVGGVIGLVVWRSSAPDTAKSAKSELSELQSSAKANQHAITQLEKELRDTKILAARAHAGVTLAEPAATAITSAAVPPPAPEEDSVEAAAAAEASHTPEQENEFFEDYFTQLGSIMQGEGVDAAWSAEVSQAVREAFGRQNLQGSKLARIECGSTLCRVDSEHADEKAREMFKMTFVGSLGGRFERFTLHAPVGALKTTTIMAKAGANLPSHRELGLSFPGDPE